jgi:hypothetical protein
MGNMSVEEFPFCKDDQPACACRSAEGAREREREKEESRAPAEFNRSGADLKRET